MASLLLKVILLVVLIPTVVESTSHWVSYTYSDWVYQWYCYPYTYTYCNSWSYYGYYGYCGWWGGCSFYPHGYGYGVWNPYYYYNGHYGWYGYWGWGGYSIQCYTAVAQNCYSAQVYRTDLTGWTCASGWTGGNCDIAICSPACAGTNVCIAPNTCDCLRNSNNQCQLSYCRDAENRNCYPGTCSSDGSTCTCPPGFTGDNCLTITNRATIDSCQVEIFGHFRLGDNLQRVAVAQCAGYSEVPLTTWINTTLIEYIQVSWNAKYTNPPSLPGTGMASYITNAPTVVKLNHTGFTLFKNNDNISTNIVNCSTTDQFSATCQTQTLYWRNIGQFDIKDNATFSINISATLGGQKIVDIPSNSGDNNHGYFGTQYFTSSSINTTNSVKFAFDLKPPKHCLSSANPDCKVFPIFLNESITTNPIIQPTFNDWTDAESGIKKFHAEIFYMQPDIDKKLANVAPVLSQKDMFPAANVSSFTDFRYTCPHPGVFSIELTVYDLSGNTAKARKILLYNDNPVSINITEKVRIDGVDVNSIETIESATDPITYRGYMTTLVKPQDNNNYMFNVRWDRHFSDSTFDPDWVLPVKSWQDMGVTGIDDNNGDRFGTRSIDAVKGNPGIVTYALAYSIDTVGGVGAVKPANSINLNSSQTNNYQLSISQANITDGVTINVWITALDNAGKSTTVVSKTFIDRDPKNIQLSPATTEKHSTDEYTTSVNIDVRSTFSGIRNITYSITVPTLGIVAKNNTFIPQRLTHAGQRRRRDSSQIYTCDPSTNRNCYCTRLDNSICYSNVQEIPIDNCWIDKYAGNNIVVSYTVYTLSGLSVSGSVTMNNVKAEDIPCRPDRLSGGAIAGIVIAVIFGFIMFVLFIVFCVLYFCFPKVGISQTMHNYTSNIPVTWAQPKFEENEIYTSKEEYVQKLKEPDVSAKGSRMFEKKLNNDDPFQSRGSPIVSYKDVSVGKVLAEGRFATISKGSMRNGNETVEIAIKALRSGHDSRDEDMMRSKILFFAKSRVRPHANIVKFMGVMEDDNSPAPVMLLELCDMPLKDWLQDNEKMTPEVMENMLNFTRNIAQGVQHLHSQDIIHRRLAVRNVLLKKTLGGLEAKLIGFGPSRDADNDDGDQSVVPIKWMAPETLDSLGNSPVYTPKTDAWSFGVTIWEIYSHGAPPYSNHRSAGMKDVLKSGERLECPEDCPPELFNNVVYPCWSSNQKKRPTFTVINNNISKFMHGAQAVGGYYTAGSNCEPKKPQMGYYAAKDVNNAGYPDTYHDANQV